MRMNAVDSTDFKPPGVAASALTARPTPPTPWLAAAATAQRRAQHLSADPDAELTRVIDPILDAWTALVLATCPNAHVPSDMQLLEHAEALLRRHGATAGERALTWVEVSTLLTLRRASDARPVPLGRAALAAHVARLGRLIAAPPRTVGAAWRAGGLGLALLGLGALAFWLMTVDPPTAPAIGSARMR